MGAKYNPAHAKRVDFDALFTDHQMTDAQINQSLQAEATARYDADQAIIAAQSEINNTLAMRVHDVEDTAGAVPAMVNSGAKNTLILTDTETATKKGVTLTYNDDGTFTVDSDGAASTGADYFYLARSASNPVFQKDSVISGCTGGSDSTYYIGVAGTSVKQGHAAVTLTADVSGSLIFSFASGITFDNLVLKPMVCSKEDYAASHEFAPYCPTLQELYAMVLALQSVSRSVQSEPIGEEER